MSKLIQECCSRTYEKSDLLTEPERTLRVARLLGPSAVIQLSDKLTFANILCGEVPISQESIIFDRTGSRIDAAELTTQVTV